MNFGRLWFQSQYYTVYQINSIWNPRCGINVAFKKTFRFWQRYYRSREPPPPLFQGLQESSICRLIPELAACYWFSSDNGQLSQVVRNIPMLRVGPGAFKYALTRLSPDFFRVGLFPNIQFFLSLFHKYKLSLQYQLFSSSFSLKKVLRPDFKPKKKEGKKENFFILSKLFPVLLFD